VVVCEGKKENKKSRLFEFWGTRVEKRGKLTSTGSWAAVLENVVFIIKLLVPGTGTMFLSVK
jgi:hypothetical protein